MEERDTRKSLSLKFYNSDLKYPRHKQEIQYFKNVYEGFDHYGYELTWTTVEYEIMEIQDEDYTGTSIVYDADTKKLLKDKEHYKLGYIDSNGIYLPSQFFWMDVEQFFNVLNNKLVN